MSERNPLCNGISPLSDERTLDSLRAALAVSPENTPLRVHFAELLMRLRRHEEAETEYRTALGFDADNLQLKIALAQCFYEQAKNNEALVIVKSLAQAADPPPKSMVLYARLLLRAGDERGAAHQYRTALDLDEDQFDEDLSDQFGDAADGKLGRRLGRSSGLVEAA